MESTPQNPTLFQAWWMAIRPRTLPASIAGVVMGISVTWLEGKFDLLPALAALFIGILLQIGSNLANDVYDFHRGADTPDRLGPTRVTTAGILTPRQVKTGMLVVFGTAALLGFYLFLHSGWWVLLIGISAILSAILYTGGPYPLGYHGLGDLFVFIFFGLAAVCGTYFAQVGRVSTIAWWMAIPVGLIVVDLLVVNNLRDINTDRAVGKRTMAVRIGAKWTKVEYIALMVIAFLMIPAGILLHLIPPISLLVFLSIPRAWYICRLVLTTTGRSLNKALAATSQFALIYSTFFLLSILIGKAAALI